MLRLLALAAFLLATGLSIAHSQWFGQGAYFSAVHRAPSSAGVCGSANGVATSSAPTTNLCSVGTASAVTGSGPWNWTCNGTGGGTNASCSAPTSGGGGSVPQPAMDAGFTTVALNSDFTDSGHATIGQWLGGCGATGDPEWYIGWVGFSTGPGCGAFSMAADTATGTPQALRMQWINSYLGSNPNATVMETINLPVTQGRMVTNFYIEMVARLGVVETNINPDWWNTGTFGSTALDDGGTVEWDGYETVGPGQYGTTIHNWSGPNNDCGHWCVGSNTNVIPDTNYHRFAWRATGRLGDGYTLNSYFENVPFSSGLNKVATVNMGPAATNGTSNANPHLSGGTIATAPIISIGSAGNTLAQDGVLWVKSIKLYVCPAWTANQTGPGKTIGGAQQCFTSVQDP